MFDGLKAFNEKGGLLVNDTNAYSSAFFGLQVIEDAVIDFLIIGEKEEGNYSGKALKAGTYLPVEFSTIQLVSGTMLLGTTGNTGEVTSDPVLFLNGDPALFLNDAPSLFL